MDDFLSRLTDADKIEDKDTRIDSYVNLFQSVKYKMGAESVVVLLKMISFFDDQYQIHYHLFNHFLMMKMNEEAEKFIERLIEETSRFNEMSLKYPLQTESSERISAGFREKDFTKIVTAINESPGRDIGARYFELSIKMRDAGIDSIPEIYFKKAISLSEGKAKVKMILTFCSTLIKMGKKENAKNILSSEINSSSNEDSLPLMYKLAALFEEEESVRALAIYQEMEQIDPDFLDIKEKISKLTNGKNRYKINRLIDDKEKDDSNIHF